MDAKEFNLDPSVSTGWGITAKGVNGCDYLYTLKTDGKVTIT